MNSTRYFIDLNSIRGGDFIPEALEAPEKSSSGIDGSSTAMTMGLAMVYTCSRGASGSPPSSAMPSESKTALARGMDGIIGMGVDSGTKDFYWTISSTDGTSSGCSPFPRNYRTTLGTHNEASKWMATVFLDSTTTVAVHTAAGPLEGMTRTGITVPVFLVADFYTASVQRAATTSALSRAAFAMSTVAVLPAIAVCDALHRRKTTPKVAVTDAYPHLLVLDANHQDALDVAPRYEKIGDFDSRTSPFRTLRNDVKILETGAATMDQSSPQKVQVFLNHHSPPVIASSSQPLPALSFFRRSLPVADKDIIHENFVAHLDARGAGKGFNQQAVGFFGGALSRRDGQYVSTLRTLDALYELSLQLPINQGGRAMLSIEIGRTFDDKRHAIFLDAHQRHCRPPSPHRIDASRFWAVVTADANSDDFGNCTSLSVTQYLDDYWPRKHWTDDDCEQSRALSSAVLGWTITVDVRLSGYLPTVPGREDGAVYRHAARII
ncbi:hypothetical protein IW262DRAFT_1302359 [Armillaria fumosa]|nr:hypothetical protein IW262DRAFT_1302359 [Armillaria fumosa]